MDTYRISYADYLNEVKQFIALSDKLNDGWKLCEHECEYNTYVKKQFFHEAIGKDNSKIILQAEYLITYNLSYGVPMFSFNYWKANGVLLSLEEIKELSLLQINPEEYYSIITQQENPVLFRPYFTVHPCNTASLLSNFKDTSTNLIVSFLSILAPLVQMKLFLEYAI